MEVRSCMGGKLMLYHEGFTFRLSCVNRPEVLAPDGSLYVMKEKHPETTTYKVWEVFVGDVGLTVVFRLDTQLFEIYAPKLHQYTEQCMKTEVYAAAFNVAQTNRKKVLLCNWQSQSRYR